MGENDKIAPFKSQHYCIDLARRLLKSDPSKAKTEGYARMEPGIDGTELVTYIHPGGHKLPKEALPLVVRFFQRHERDPEETE